MAQQDIKTLKEKFADNKEPNGNDFSNLIDSFDHKSIPLEQTRVRGLAQSFDLKADKTKVNQLEGVVNGKADKSDLANIQKGLIPMGEVETPLELEAILNPQDGWAYKVKSEKDEFGNSYIYRYTIIRDENDEIVSAGWINTKLVTYEGSIAKIQEVIQPQNDDALYIVDSKQRAVAKIDQDGLHDVNIIPQSNEAFYIADKQGNVIMKADENGVQDVNIVPQNNDAFYISDKKGHVIFQADENGVNWLNKDKDLAGITIDAPLADVELDADINLCIAYGQSLSVAGSSNISVDMSPCLQFKNGVRQEYSAEQVNDPAFVANFYGDAFLPCAGTGFEGTIKRMMLQWCNLLRDENKLDLNNLGFQFIGSAPGISGTVIAGLIKGTYAYNRLLQAVEAGKRIANAENKTFNVSTLFWIQGESDYRNSETYYNDMVQLFDDLNADVKAITGQVRDVQFIVYQQASHTTDDALTRLTATDAIPMAMLRIVKEKENVHFGCAMYQFTYSDSLHLQNNGYMMMGAMAGVQAKRVLSDNKPLSAILPNKYILYPKTGGGYLLEVRFDVPVKPLVFDTSGTFYCNPNGAQPNMGFSLESIFNVTETYPLKNNVTYYTANVARAAIPDKSRFVGLVIKYQTGAGVWVTEKFYQGDPANDWLNAANWQTVADISTELVTSVRLTREDTVVIELSGNPKGLVLNYAKTGSMGGGNLRDSQGEKIKINIAGQAQPVHNWTPIFKEII